MKCRCEEKLGKTVHSYFYSDLMAMFMMRTAIPYRPWITTEIKLRRGALRLSLTTSTLYTTLRKKGDFHVGYEKLPPSLFSLSLSLSLSFLSVLSRSPYLSPALALMIADSVSNGDCLYIQTHIHTPAYRHTQAWYLACVRGAHSAVEQVDSLLTLKLSSRRGNKDMATESCPPGVLLLGGEHIVI